MTKTISYDNLAHYHEKVKEMVTTMTDEATKNINHSVSINDDLNVTGDTTISGNLFVDGNEFNLWNGLAVYKNNNLLYSNGNIDVANANIRGDATINGLVTTSTHKQYYLPVKMDNNYPEYYLLAKLPLSDSTSHSMIRINGIIGGWSSNRKTIVDFFIAIRDQRIVEGDFYGSQFGFEWFDFKLHEASDGWYIYLRRKEQYTSEIILDAMLEQGTWYGETTSSSPIGTDRETIDQSYLGKTFKNRIFLPSNNLNDWKMIGSYVYDNGSQGYVNCPTSDGIHILNVFNNGGTDWVAQEDYVLRYGASSIEKYIRQYSPPGWSSWQLVSEDTGWVDCTLTSNFEQTGWDNLKFRKKNGVVSIGGAIVTKNSTSWTMTITTLPVGFRPPGEFDVVCRTSWNQVMKIAINSDGTVSTLNLSDGQNLPANEYIFITATYIV